MATITYPVGVLIDDSGTPLSAPVATLASVTDKAGNVISSPGASVNLAGAFCSVDYDAETHGEAIITLAVSQSGRTITKLNAAPVIYAAKDSSRVLNADVATSTRLAITGYTTPPALPSTYPLSANDEAVLARLYAMTTSANVYITGAFPSPTALTQNDIDATFVSKVAAGTITAFFADTRGALLLADVNGVFDYNETTHVLTLKDKTGTTTLATLTMTPGTAAITHRASA